jgi:hypothetical protein
MRTKFWLVSLKEIDNFRDLDVLERTTLDGILRKYDLDDLAWPDRTQNTDRRQALVNTMNFELRKMLWNFLSS